MSLRNILLIAAALLITVVTTFVARSWLESQRAQPVPVAQKAPEPQGIKVLVAKVALPTGVFIQEEQLRWQIWPDDEIPEDYITDHSEAGDPSRRTRFPRRRVAAGLSGRRDPRQRHLRRQRPGVPR